MICVSLLILFSSLSFAAEDEFNLDDEFSTDTVTPPASATEQQPQPSQALELDSLPLKSNEEADITGNSNLASPLEVLQHENAMYGFSAGLVMATQPFYSDYVVRSALPDKATNQQTDPLQSFGIMIRYAIVPFYKLGTDINVSFLKSQNHKSVTVNQKALTEVTTLKGELNFTYAIELAGSIPLYFLVGIGTEQVSGGDIENLLKSNGAGGQAGAGITVLSTINLEMLYSYYEHRISNDLVGRETSGFPIRSIDTQKAKIISKGPLVRGTYSFKF